MIGPDGRDIITVPAGGTTALEALGWTIISTATETVTDAETNAVAEPDAEYSAKKPAPKRKPAQKRQTTTGARRRIPKPGDADD